VVKVLLREYILPTQVYWPLRVNRKGDSVNVFTAMADELLMLVYIPGILECVRFSLSALNQVAVGCCKRPGLVLVTVQVMLK
jgi:hypothetical protein